MRIRKIDWLHSAGFELALRGLASYGLSLWGWPLASLDSSSRAAQLECPLRPLLRGAAAAPERRSPC